MTSPNASRLRQVSVDTEETEIVQPQPQDNSLAIEMMLTALKALSQRALIALASLFTASLVLSVWYLWYSVLPNPTILQLVGLGMYAAFVLAVLAISRRVK